MTIAAAHLGLMGSAQAQSNETTPAALPSVKPGTNTSFGALKQIDAGVLNVGYAERTTLHDRFFGLITASRTTSSFPQVLHPEGKNVAPRGKNCCTPGEELLHPGGNTNFANH
jgi:hypothetical protein